MSQAPGILPAIKIELGGTVRSSSVQTETIVGWVMLPRRLQVPVQLVIASVCRFNVMMGVFSSLFGNSFIKLGLSWHCSGNNKGKKLL